MLLLQAIAKEAGASFINIRASTLQSKWFGETQKLTQAIFTLASKLQPCIVFIGEPLQLHFCEAQNLSLAFILARSVVLRSLLPWALACRRGGCSSWAEAGDRA